MPDLIPTLSPAKAQLIRDGLARGLDVAWVQRRFHVSSTRALTLIRLAEVEAPLVGAEQEELPC
jgi:hypothetical protein